MSRLTKRRGKETGITGCVKSCTDCYGLTCGYVKLAMDKLAHYEDLEEQLEKLFGGKLPLDKVVESLKRTVQNGEEKLDFARILTNAEAEKWDRWKDLEEQGRLIELPCKVGDTVYMIQRRYTKCSKHQEYRDEYNCQGCEELVCDSHIEYYISPLNSSPIDWIVKMESQFGDTVFLTKEEAEAKLAELKGTE